MPILLLKEEQGSAVLEQAVAEFNRQGKLTVSQELKAENLAEIDTLVIAADVNQFGENYFISQLLSTAFNENREQLKGLQVALIIVSESIYFSKNYARRLAFILNQNGLYMRGQALLEIVSGYQNFKTWQKVYKLDLKEVAKIRLEKFYQGLIALPRKRKKILALHASERSKSNTYALWRMLKTELMGYFEIEERHIENGEVIDCKGCGFNTCLHYANQKSCYYGGQVTAELLPAIETADIIIWVCPNYNDAVSAMHTALINRLTVLYRRIDLSVKQVYGIIVSANSGSDILAEQLIGALNFNKGFMLPANAFLMANANDPGSIYQVAGIEEKVQDFADNIIRQAEL